MAVLIVGAGLAGLTAARRLTRAGVDVTVLDASRLLDHQALELRPFIARARIVVSRGRRVRWNESPQRSGNFAHYDAALHRLDKAMGKIGSAK